MKFKIPREKIKQAVSVAEKITGKDASLPILGNIMLKAEDNYLSVIATNLETGIIWDLLAKTETAGSAVLPAGIFSGLVSSLPGSTLLIDKKNDTVSVVDEKTKSNLISLAPEEFPTLPIIDGGDYFNVRADIFCQALTQVANFSGTSSVKPEINGVCVVIENDNIKIVATDSFRLGEKKISTAGKGLLSKKYSIILPARAVREIVAVFGNFQKNIIVYLSDNQMMIDFSDDDGGGRSRIRFMSRLIDGEFPDYQAIIPDAHTTQIGFLKKEILFQLKPAQIFSGKNSEITVEVSVKDKVAKIASRAADFGGYEGETGLLVAEGKDIAIVFNNRFLIDGLSAITADECFLGFSGDDGPALLRSKTGDDFIYIIMPIKKY